ncbi:hypothetical protein QOT17_024988 [Balamuthia mandrillaris]
MGLENSNIYRRMWTKDTVGTVEGRSIVVSSKDLKKEKVCDRIFELGLKHVESRREEWNAALESYPGYGPGC